jgi:hypothetical protein
VWGGVLLVTGYSMGTLYEHKSEQIRELQETYHGVLMILRHFIAKDAYTENHSYRVSIYAAKIAASVGLTSGRIEDVRAAALLHDIGKLDISRDLLYKAARSPQKTSSSTGRAPISTRRSSTHSLMPSAGGSSNCPAWSSDGVASLYPVAHLCGQCPACVVPRFSAAIGGPGLKAGTTCQHNCAAG